MENLKTCQDKKCYHVSWYPAVQQLTVAREWGVDFIDMQKSQIINVVELDGKYAFTAEAFDGSIIIGVNNIQSQDMRLVHREIKTLDRNYREISSWSAPKHMMDFAVLAGQIFITASMDQRDDFNILVFTLDGKYKTKIDVDGFPTGIAAVSSDAVVYSDDANHRVCMRRVTEVPYEIIWSVKVVKPASVCIADNGLIWVRSDVNDCITVLSQEGR